MFWNNTASLIEVFSPFSRWLFLKKDECYLFFLSISCSESSVAEKGQSSVLLWPLWKLRQIQEELMHILISFQDSSVLREVS